MNSTRIAPVFVPQVKADKQADVPKVNLASKYYITYLLTNNMKFSLSDYLFCMSKYVVIFMLFS